jgi:hypothetical protein
MSKFKGILDVAKSREPEPVDVPDPDPPAPPAPVVPAPMPSPAPPVAPPPERRPGRPRGKRSDPGFVQVTAYIPDDLHHNIKLALLQERKGREFSELVGELLTAWLESRS